MTSYLTVPNLNKWQHYKDRTPPWIKLHRDLLRDYKFSTLPDEAKAHLMLIWLLASQMENKIPDEPKFIQSQIGATKVPDIKLLITHGFLERVASCEQDASEALAECKQVAVREEETEAEEDTEEEIISEAKASSIIPPKKKTRIEYPEEFEQFRSAYPPNHASRVDTWKSYQAALKKGATHENLIRGATEYAAYISRTGTEIQHTKHATTWLNKQCWTVDYSVTTIPKPAASSNLDSTLAALARAGARFGGTEPMEHGAGGGTAGDDAGGDGQAAAGTRTLDLGSLPGAPERHCGDAWETRAAFSAEEHGGKPQNYVV